MRSKERNGTSNKMDNEIGDKKSQRSKVNSLLLTFDFKRLT